MKTFDYLVKSILIIFMYSAIYANCEELSIEECESVDYCMLDETGGCVRVWDGEDDDWGWEEEDDIVCSDINNPYECIAVGCDWEQSNNLPGGGSCFEYDDEDGDWEDEYWFDCEELSMDECESVDYCMLNAAGECVRAWDDEDGDWDNNADPSLDQCQELTQDECSLNERCDWDDYYGCFGIDWDSNGYFKGDINIDYQHNVTDIIQQINIILDNHNPSGYEIWAADMNTDISIDILDVVELGNVILGVSRNYNNKLTSSARLEGNELSIFGSIGGIQVSGELINQLIGNDMILTSNGISVIYNMNGKLDSDKFIFSSNPSNIIIASINAEIVPVTVSLPNNFELQDAYPNPFNPLTNFKFLLRNNAHVVISIYDISGREIESIVNTNLDVGYHTFTWNADNYCSGLYLMKMISGENIKTQKLMLVK